jgi:hypothetical protein
VKQGRKSLADLLRLILQVAHISGLNQGGANGVGYIWRADRGVCGF